MKDYKWALIAFNLSTLLLIIYLFVVHAPYLLGTALGLTLIGVLELLNNRPSK